MRRGSTPFQSWQFAGCPTIPQKHYPHVGYFKHLADRAEARNRAKAALDAYSKKSGDSAKKGFLSRAASAVGRFFQRRRS